MRCDVLNSRFRSLYLPLWDSYQPTDNRSGLSFYFGMSRVWEITDSFGS